MEIEKYKNTVFVAIAIQKLGQATCEEIYEKLTKDKVDITLSQIERECKKLQKKGLISTNYVNQKGINVIAYSPQKSIFSRDTEKMQYSDIVDSKEAKELISELDQKKGASKGRLPDHRDYYDVNIVFKVKDKVLGFMPFTKEGYNEFYREGKEVIFLPQHFRAWFGHNLRLINKSNSLRNYIGFDYGKTKVNGTTEKIQFPILDGRQGRGFCVYEVLPKGSEIITSFKVPKSDFTMTEFKDFLEMICEHPIRGFGGRSMTGFGRLTIEKFDSK